MWVSKLYREWSIFIMAAVWFVNGFVCKVLGWVPRHKEIVARILSDQFAPVLVVLIGLSEVVMAIWILWRIYPRLNAWSQILLVGVMNLLEMILASDLLLWGYFNVGWAGCFMFFVWWTQLRKEREC